MSDDERALVWEAYVEWCARNDPERTGDYGVFVGGYDAGGAEVGRLEAQARRLRELLDDARYWEPRAKGLEAERDDLRARLAAAEGEIGLYETLRERIRASAHRMCGDWPCYCRPPQPSPELGHERRCQLLAQALKALDAAGGNRE